MKFAKENPIMYQVFALILYLIGITITETMAITLPVYILMASLPYLGSLRRFNSGFQLFYFFYIGIYLFLGFLFQDSRESLVAFCSRLFQFAVLMWFYNNSDIKEIKIDAKKIVLIAVFLETLLGVYLVLTADLVSESGLVRIIAGRQPVGGNFTIAIIPIMIWGYYHETKIRKWIIRCGYVLAVWVVLSGTRGYMLLYGISLFPIYLNYWFSRKQSRSLVLGKLSIVALVVFMVVLAVALNPELLSSISDMLRLESGTGIRDAENRVSIQTCLDTTIFHKLFGMGLGGVARDIPGYEQAVLDNMEESWARSTYLSRVGVSFHNLFANILLLQGIIGIVVMVLVFCWEWRRISALKYVLKQEKLCYKLYWIGFFLMNYYRWSCDCGVSEMIMFSLVVSKVSIKTNKAVQ